MPHLDVNGLNMYYEIHGDGPPLLLLHGGADSIPKKWLPLFAPHFRVIAPEQMGHGRTPDLVDREFHYHAMAEDTVGLMRGLKIDSAAVVGYSDGGIIGLDLAINHPERVTCLALTGANARTDGYTRENQAWLRTLDVESRPAVFGRLQPMWLSEPDYADDELRRITAPTLLVIGDRDIVTPEHAVEMFRTIPGAQLCVVPNAGHGAMPAETVVSFLREAAGLTTG